MFMKGPFPIIFEAIVIYFWVVHLPLVIVTTGIITCLDCILWDSYNSSLANITRKGDNPTYTSATQSNEFRHHLRGKWSTTRYLDNGGTKRTGVGWGRWSILPFVFKHQLCSPLLVVVLIMFVVVVVVLIMFSFLLFTLSLSRPSPQASHEGDAGALEMGLLDGMGWKWCSWHLESKGNLRVINQHCPSIIPTNNALFSGGERGERHCGRVQGPRGKIVIVRM